MKSVSHIITALLVLLSQSFAKAESNNPRIEAFENFLCNVREIPTDSLPNAVKNLMNSATQNPDDYKALYNLATDTFFSINSKQRNDNCYMLFLREAINSNILGEADTERAKFRLEMIMKNRPGSQAPDFSFVTREGSETLLSKAIHNKNTLLLFYDPDCDHCMETISRLCATKLPASLSIIAIDPEEDKKLWDITKQELPKDWTVGFAITSIQENETYIFPEMPTLYLLDSNGIITVKEASLEQILNLKD